MLRKVAAAVVAAGCIAQGADAFAVGPASLARSAPTLRATSALRPRRDSLCPVNMGEICCISRESARNEQLLRWRHVAPL